MKLSEIAELVDGDIEGDPRTEISGVGKIETASANEVTFISNPLYEKFYETTNAGCIIVSREFEVVNRRKDVSLLRVDDPYLSFVRLLETFDTAPEAQTGISDTAVIGENCELDDELYIGEFVIIGNNCTVGKGTRISNNCSVGRNVKIGALCIIHPNVTLYDGCVIGNNVVIHAGTVIGSDGFGFAREKDGSFRKIPQTGNVVISDDVEIGSNTSIDRATLGSTFIGKGVKIDNQVQIAHNVEIGENTAIAAQVGIAGSTKVGNRCLIAGQAGLVGHITICDDVIIGASVGVSKSITEPGLYTGYRAKPSKEDLRSEIRIRNLEQLEKRLKEIELKIQNQNK